MLTAANSPHDLPLYSRLHPASQHDAVSFVVSRICLPTQIHQNIEPFIDLNVRGTKNLETNGDIKISPEGIPVCSRGKKMRHDGFDRSQNRHKWKCPTTQVRTTNTCPKPCSTAKYGRTGCLPNTQPFA